MRGSKASYYKTYTYCPKCKKFVSQEWAEFCPNCGFFFEIPVVNRPTRKQTQQ